MASLNPRSGTLGIRLASHLLRRTTFQYDRKRIDEFASKTAAEAVAELLNFPALNRPTGPVSYEDGKRIFLPDYKENETINKNTRGDAAVNWFLHESLLDPSMRHKLAWFLHTCFVTSSIGAEEIFYHIRLLQTFAAGNLRILAEKMTLDNQMLDYLDNGVNTKFKPNENYAREFLELFTILKGEQIGDGDYTNYTEADIVEAAKIFTGFRKGEEVDPDTKFLRGQIKLRDHETGDKTFSKAFNNKVIKGRDTEKGMYEELAEFVQMVYDQKETASAFCRRLYRFFVKDAIDQETEKDIIEGLATQLYNNDYQLQPVLETLFTSTHFYDEDDADSTDETIGAKIKSPLDLIFGMFSFFQMESVFPNPTKVGNGEAEDYHKKIWGYVKNVTDSGRMKAMEPPSVLGYEPYGQGPTYSRLWFDGASILGRLQIPGRLLGDRNRARSSISKIVDFRLDIVKYVDEHITNPDNADALILQLATYLLPELPAKDRLDYFKDLLLNEIPDMDWTLDWYTYKQTKDEEYVRIPLRNLVQGILKSPEYQIL